MTRARISVTSFTHSGKAMGKWLRTIRTQKGILKRKSPSQSWSHWILVLIFFVFYLTGKIWNAEVVPHGLQSNERAFETESNQLNSSSKVDETTKFSNQLMLFQNIPSASPLSNNAFTISSVFGVRIHPVDRTEKFHNGIDMATPIGTLVYSTANGRIEKIGNQLNGLGNYIVIEHSLGYESIYGHLQESLIREGDTVSAHQTIALSGNSGKTTGPHLHYSVLKDSINIDPMPTLNLKYEFLKTILQEQDP